jgi:nucleoside-diphosphate-sugar epimerase
VDTSKLSGLTGWQPQVSLEEGLRRTVEWYRAHPAALGPQAP